MDTDTETVQEEVQHEEPMVQSEEREVVEEATEEVQEEREEEKVPLSALQKERRKRQDAEARYRIYEEMQAKQSQQAQPQDEDDLYEAVTKADLGKHEKQVLRTVEEKSWIKQNPERAQEVNDNLSEFLKQKPNLAPAIEGATNRYEEAWTLMNALSPKQKAALKPQAARKVAPGSPTAMPKAAGMNQSVDVMNMSDEEFANWRKGQRRAR